MKILFAAPDRDLLECYKTILENDMGETVTAFDGAQVLSLLQTEKFDLAALDCDLPRVEFDCLIKKFKEKNVPVIALTNGITARQAPDAYLPYPFTPEQLEDVIRGVTEKTGKG